ncbi:MAG: hypothetical protein ACI9M9_000088 [Flavobacteriaceae bacterium]|jgi:hypothetical protein
MKHFTSIVLIIFTSFIGLSQTYEVGAILGGANLIGDVGSTTYISPNTLAFGVIGKWNRSSRHAFRFSIISAKVKGDDADSHETRREERGYTFDNNITEISAGLEYSFWEFDTYSARTVYTPYLFTGINYFLYEAAWIRPGTGEFFKYKGGRSISIPMVIGFKAMIAPQFTMGFEIGARYTFVDDIDGSNTTSNSEAQNNEDFKFGNLNNNDWYVFTTVYINFTFGRKPCYCNF